MYLCKNKFEKKIKISLFEKYLENWLKAHEEKDDLKESLEKEKEKEIYSSMITFQTFGVVKRIF
jgi:hypothetical protein